MEVNENQRHSSWKIGGGRLEIGEPSGIALTKKELPVWRKCDATGGGVSHAAGSVYGQVIEVIGETKGLGDIR